MTTSSYVPVPVTTTAPVSDTVWRSDVPAYSIIRQVDAPVVSTRVYNQAPAIAYSTRYVNQPLYSSGYVSYGYPAYSTLGTRRLSTGLITEAPVVINEAPVVVSDLRSSSYIAPLRTSYVSSAPLRSSYYLA